MSHSRRVLRSCLPALGLLFVLAPHARAQQVALPGRTIPQFVEPLPSLPRVDLSHTSRTQPLEVSLEEFQQHVLPDSFYHTLAAPYREGTWVWSYVVPGQPRTSPGVTLEAKVGRPAAVRFVNHLQGPNGEAPFLQSLLPIDQTLHWADPLGQHGSTAAYVGPVPSVTHLHGGETPSASDGAPGAWSTPGLALKGPDFVTDVYTYPNAQEPATLWYHDHTLGATRTTVYAGLAGMYLLRDAWAEPANLPGGPADREQDRYGHPYERELVIQDRMFDTNGQLVFPGEGVNPEVHPFWMPEFFGDVIVVNGRSWPYLQVEPRRYRFRVVNGSNARFYELHLNEWVENGAEVKLWQIGTDGGLLDAPVALNDPASATPQSLILAPGERADLIVDFAGLEGRTLLLSNRANEPYPDGDPNDPLTSGRIMQFRVGTDVSRAPMVNNGYDRARSPGHRFMPRMRMGVDCSFNPATATRLRRNPIERPAVPSQVTRALTLNEQMGANGPLAGFVNNTMYEHGLVESMTLGSTEVWQIVNLTGDTHPVHLHLVQFQVLSRQDFDVDGYMNVYGMPMEGMGPPLPYDEVSARTGFKLGGNPDVTPFLQGDPEAVDANENGWKDTFRMNPGQVTTLLIRVAPQNADRRSGGTLAAGMNLFPFDPAAGPSVADDGFGYPGGPGYVWHCHILDHEDNDMMRPLGFAHATSPGRGPAAALPFNARTVTLSPAEPNPSAGWSRIAFSLPEAHEVSLSVYDLNGRRVTELAKGRYAAGDHALEWNGLDARGHRVPSGAYLYRLTTGGVTQTRKLVLMH